MQPRGRWQRAGRLDGGVQDLDWRPELLAVATAGTELRFSGGRLQEPAQGAINQVFFHTLTRQRRRFLYGSLRAHEGRRTSRTAREPSQGWQCFFYWCLAADYTNAEFTEKHRHLYIQDEDGSERVREKVSGLERD